MSVTMTPVYFDEFYVTRQLILDLLPDAQAAARYGTLSVPKAVAVVNQSARHCALQNDAFYAYLKSAHQDNASALKIIDFFIYDLKELKIKIFVFEEKYLAEKMHVSKNFSKDFLELSREILTRVDMETAQLFPLLSL